MLAMNAGLASWLFRVVAIVSDAPAENPIMPTRSGSTCHFAALARTRVKAALASAICGSMWAVMEPGEGRDAGRVPGADGRAKASRSAGVWVRRYLSTKAA